MTLPKISGDALAWGLLAVGVMLWLRAGQDKNQDGRQDGLLAGLGYDAGRVVPDVLGGVVGGVADGVRDVIWDLDKCTKAHQSGNWFYVLWHCPPTRTFDNEPGL